MRLPALIALCLLSPLQGETERDWQLKWAKEHGGRVEVMLPDKTRADIVTATHVIEVEWAANWYEAVGQSLWYAFQLDGVEGQKRRPGIVLILREQKDYEYFLKLNSLIKHYGLEVDTWTTGVKTNK